MNTPATFNSFYAIGPSLAADIPEMESTLNGPNRVSNTFVMYDIELCEVISTILTSTNKSTGMDKITMRLIKGN